MEGQGVDVALKVKHCEHHKNTIAKLKMYNMKSVIKRVDINTHGVLLGEIGSNFGKSNINLRGINCIKDNHFGLKYGYGG